MRINKASSWLALVLSISLPMGQVQASQQSVESALNELQYSLTVEWDQKDAAFEKAALEKFAAQIDALKKQGVSNEEIIATLKSKALDAKSAQDVERIAQLAKNKQISQKEMVKMVRDAVAQNTTQGASWSGVGTGIVIGVIVVAVIVAILTADHTSVGVTYYDPYYDCYYDYYWDEYYCYYY